MDSLNMLVSILIAAFIAQTALVNWRLGKLEGAVKKTCPFGTCPVFERAKDEAAPKRDKDA